MMIPVAMELEFGPIIASVLTILHYLNHEYVSRYKFLKSFK